VLDQVLALPYGPERIALVEQVVAGADAAGAADLQFRARMQATVSYVYSGEPVRSFATFAWCVAEYDRDPARYADQARFLLWHHKYMVTGLTRFPDLPLDRAYDTLDQMQQRWADGGYSPHAVYAYRHRLAIHVGDQLAAQEWYGRWCEATRDDLSDCAGCDPSAKALYLAGLGRDEEAVALAEPVLRGEVACSEQPQDILTTLLLPYLRTGRLEQARDAHRRAYRLHRRHLADLGRIAAHLEFCALTGNEARGIDILERHLGWLDRAPSPHAAMEFAAAGALLLRRAREVRHPIGAVRRPGFGHRPALEVDPSALAIELASLALDTAAEFDERNGTEQQSAVVRERLDAVPLVEYLPLAPVPHVSALVVPLKSIVDTSGLAAAKDPDALLDLAEEHLRHGRREEAFAAWHAFDDRYAAAELTPLQRGRRADGHGVEAANQDALPEAETAWRSAAALFAQAGDEVRRQGTRGRIGRAMCATGRGQAGLSMVEEAASYLLAHTAPDRWTGALVAVATAQLYVGRPEDALATLERAAEYLSSCVDPHAPAHIAVQRAQCLGGLGRMADARVAAEEAVRVSRECGFAEGIAHASMMAGFAAEQLGDAEGAIDAYDRAIEAATDLDLLRRVRSQRAGLLAGTARAPEAIDDLLATVADRTAADDLEGAHRARHGLAIAYLNADRPLDSADVAEEALAYFAIQAMNESNVDSDVAGHAMAVRHLLATAYHRIGQHEEAMEQLDQISTECARQGNHAAVGQMAEEVADILDTMDRDAAAAARFMAAAEAYRCADQPVDEFRCRRQHATSLLWAHDVPGALAALATADELSLSLPADEHGRWERAMVLYDGARILRNADRLGEATLRAGGSAAAFRQIGFPVQAAHAEMLHAELLLRTGRAADAEAAARRALAELPEDEEGHDRLVRLLQTARDAAARDGDADLDAKDPPEGGE
jgi:tetratricopeptide (TPR) repeat protein